MGSSSGGGSDSGGFSEGAKGLGPGAFSGGFSVDNTGLSVGEGSPSAGFGSDFGGGTASRDTGGGQQQGFRIDNTVGPSTSLLNQPPTQGVPQGPFTVDNSVQDPAGMLFPNQQQPPGQVININPPTGSQGAAGEALTERPQQPPAPPPQAAPPAQAQTDSRRSAFTGRPRPERSLLTIGLAETTRKNLLGI